MKEQISPHPFPSTTTVDFTTTRVVVKSKAGYGCKFKYLLSKPLESQRVWLRFVTGQIDREREGETKCSVCKRIFTVFKSKPNIPPSEANKYDYC